MILRDTHAWVCWLHPEANAKLPDDLRNRIIIATAQAHGARLVTADETVQRYPDLKTVWTI